MRVHNNEGKPGYWVPFDRYPGIRKYYYCSLCGMGAFSSLAEACPACMARMCGEEKG